jgi:RNA recognition motif
VNSPADGSGLEVQISGWDGSNNRNDVIAFLLRKFHVQVQNYRFQGQWLYCSAPNQAAYQTLLGASGVRFAGKSLHVQPSQNASTFGGSQDSSTTNSYPSQQTQSIYDKLKTFLSRRYNAENGFLDLGNLMNDEALQAAGFFNSPTTQSKVRVHIPYSSTYVSFFLL